MLEVKLLLTGLVVLIAIILALRYGPEPSERAKVAYGAAIFLSFILTIVTSIMVIWKTFP